MLSEPPRDGYLAWPRRKGGGGGGQPDRPFFLEIFDVCGLDNRLSFVAWEAGCPAYQFKIFLASSVTGFVLACDAK